MKAKVAINPEICHGKPVISGSRVMVWQILEMLEAGRNTREVYKAYPTLPQGAVEVALHYAAEQTKSDFSVPYGHESNFQVFAG
jgi:uncharacterized protein (DUF433 family)